MRETHDKAWLGQMSYKSLYYLFAPDKMYDPKLFGLESTLVNNPNEHILQYYQVPWNIHT